jgi:hypothetical protein
MYTSSLCMTMPLLKSINRTHVYIYTYEWTNLLSPRMNNGHNKWSLLRLVKRRKMSMVTLSMDRASPLTYSSTERNHFHYQTIEINVCWDEILSTPVLRQISPPDHPVEMGRTPLSISVSEPRGSASSSDERSATVQNASNDFLDGISRLLIVRSIGRIGSSTVVHLWSRCDWPHNSCWRTVVTRTQFE